MINEADINPLQLKNKDENLQIYCRPFGRRTIAWIPAHKRFAVLNNKFTNKKIWVKNTAIRYYPDLKKAKVDTPLNVCWSLINWCNLNCHYCLDTKGIPEVSSRKRKEYLKKILASNVLSIDFSGGEPLIVKDIFNLLETASKHEVYISLTTNGYYLTENVIDRLAESLNLITISIDGAKPETHDRLRGQEGLFNHCITSLQKLITKGVDTRVNTVVMPSTLNETEELVLMCKDMGVKEISLRQILPLGYGRQYSETPKLFSIQFKTISEFIQNKYTSTDFRVSLKSADAHNGHIVIWANGEVKMKKYSANTDEIIKHIDLGNLDTTNLFEMFDLLPSKPSFILHKAIIETSEIS